MASSSTKRPGFFQRHNQPFLYIANLIGYVRVIGVVYAFAKAETSIRTCLVVYFFSFACDAVDGKAARAFNQSSKLGAVLDMATDRIATAGLLALLCKFAPDYYLVWIVLIMLDVSSHWFQMYVALAHGEASHKETTAQNPLIKFYYTQRAFMGFCCISCEALYLAVYATCHPLATEITQEAPRPLILATQWIAHCPEASHVDTVPALAIAIAVWGCLTKQIVNVYQLLGSMQRLAALESKSD